MSEKQTRTAYIRLLNGLVYLFSGDPDLREYKRPAKDDTSMSRKEKDRIISHCGNEDAILVSWDWKKPRTFEDKEWASSGHFWWKPCGPGKKLRVWDWREGSVKHRRQGKDNERNDNP